MLLVNTVDVTSFKSLFLQLLKTLEAQEGLISQWAFPGGCLLGDGTGDAVQQLKGYMELLRNTVLAADLLRPTQRESISKTQQQ